jgi:orotidine-5'-phosphate decarboxylase
MSAIRELIPSLDTTDLEAALRLVEATAGEPFVYGYKVGFALGLGHGLPAVIRAIRERTPKPVIYDHQKAGTDIPDTGALFASLMRDCGVDEVILFPQAGPATLEAWVHAHQERGLRLVIGALMTHASFLASEGGFIADDAVVRILALSARAGVRDFVVPLTRPERTRRLLEDAGIDPRGEARFYSPGLGAQGGDPAAFGFLRHHRLIAGRTLLRASDPAARVREIRDAIEPRSTP